MTYSIPMTTGLTSAVSSAEASPTTSPPCRADRAPTMSKQSRRPRTGSETTDRVDSNHMKSESSKTNITSHSERSVFKYAMDKATPLQVTNSCITSYEERPSYKERPPHGVRGRKQVVGRSEAAAEAANPSKCCREFITPVKFDRKQNLVGTHVDNHDLKEWDGKPETLRGWLIKFNMFCTFMEFIDLQVYTALMLRLPPEYVEQIHDNGIQSVAGVMQYLQKNPASCT